MKNKYAPASLAPTSGTTTTPWRASCLAVDQFALIDFGRGGIQLLASALLVGHKVAARTFVSPVGN
jgi:hypothetical protein